MVPPVSDRVSPAPPYSGYRCACRQFHVRGFHALRPAFPGVFHYRLTVQCRGPSTPRPPRRPRFGLLRVRSPLLAESLLISFPGLLRWFTSPGIAPPRYFIRARGARLAACGLPHSGTPGSMDVCSSPGLFAACRALHRQRAPRHPPWTYASLDHIASPPGSSHARRPASFKPGGRALASPRSASLSFPSLRISNIKETFFCFLTMGQNRVELLTPALSERCSNQLSYCPKIGKKEDKRPQTHAQFFLGRAYPAGPRRTPAALPSRSERR